MQATLSGFGVQFHPGFTGRIRGLDLRPEFRVHQGRMPLFLRQNGHGADLPWEAAVGHCPCDSPSPSCERLGISSSSRLQILRLGKVRGAMVSAKVIGIRCLSPYPGQNLSTGRFPHPHHAFLLLTILDKVPYLQAVTCVYILWKKKRQGQCSKPGSWVSGVRMLLQHGSKSGRCM